MTKIFISIRSFFFKGANVEFKENNLQVTPPSLNGIWKQYHWHAYINEQGTIAVRQYSSYEALTRYFRSFFTFDRDHDLMAVNHKLVELVREAQQPDSSTLQNLVCDLDIEVQEPYISRLKNYSSHILADIQHNSSYDALSSSNQLYCLPKLALNIFEFQTIFLNHIFLKANEKSFLTIILLNIYNCFRRAIGYDPVVIKNYEVINFTPVINLIRSKIEQN